MRRANRLGGGYQPIPAQPEENPEEGEIGQETEDTKEHSIIKRGENLPIIGLSEYNKNGKEAKNFRINHIVGNLTAHNKATEENKHKKTEFEFLMDLMMLFSKTAIDPDLTRVRNSMRNEEQKIAPDG